MNLFFRKELGALRKLLMVLLIGFMLVPLTAVGEDNAQIVTFSTTTERVKLRERPDDNARVMGQYYGGQPLEILEQGKKWDYVSIGGRTGYMMRKYLTDLTEEAAAPVAEAYPEGESLSLYDQAGGNGRVIGTVEGEFELLGIVSQDWLHVRQVQADGTVLVGFVSALGTTWAGDGGERQVATRDNTKLALYAEPSKQSENLGEFFNGVVFQTLIETENVNGWVHVSLDGYTGYMQTSSLTAEVADVPLPTGRCRTSSCAYYAAYDAEERAGTIFAAAVFTVLAVRGDRCLVTLSTPVAAPYIWLNSADIQYGYITIE